MGECERIKVAIAGYGNLGRGVELAVLESPDMRLTNIFTRREPKGIVPLAKGTAVLGAAALEDENPSFEPPDVLLVCGGSAQDLPQQSPRYARRYNIVDSFDNHAEIWEHYEKVEKSAKQGGRLAVIAAGWDPGLFSLIRLMSEAVLPCGQSLTFWGEGISQGHSDAIRRIEGVADARQYTIPSSGALEAARNGRLEEIYGKGLMGMHERRCFVAAEDGADRERIREEIIHMPNYFEGYKTEVNFVSMEELREKHGAMPHGGTVIRSGRTGRALPCPAAALPSSEKAAADTAAAVSRATLQSNSAPTAAFEAAPCSIPAVSRATLEFSLKLDSNPEFTAGVMTAYARAAYRMAKLGETGARTVFQIPPVMLSPLTHPEAVQSFL